MKKLALAAFALGLSCASVAYAKPDQGDGDRYNRGSQQQQDQRYDRRRGGDQQQQQQDRRSRQDRNWGDRRGGDNFPNVQRRRDWNRATTPNRGWNDQNTRYSRDRDRMRDRNRGYRDTRYSQYRRNFSSQRRYNVGYYGWPRGYRYHRYGFGQFLPFVFISAPYFLTDWYDYGLFEPPYGLVWVRYGPDALLIDRETGEIVQVRYNVFY